MPPEEFKCGICNRQLSTQEALKRHIEEHMRAWHVIRACHRMACPVCMEGPFHLRTWHVRSATHKMVCPACRGEE